MVFFSGYLSKVHGVLSNDLVWLSVWNLLGVVVWKNLLF